MYYNCGIAIAKRQTKQKLHLSVAVTCLQNLIIVSPDFSPFSLTTLWFSDFSSYVGLERGKINRTVQLCSIV